MQARGLALLCCVYLLVAGGAMAWWLRSMGAQTTVVDTVICLLPALVGAALAATSRLDWRQYVARLVACVLFLPILLLMWGSSQDLPPAISGIAFQAPGLAPRGEPRVWPFALGCSLTHALLFCAGVLWAGAATTTVRATPGVVAVPADALRGRLRSLNASGAPLLVSDGAAPGTLIEPNRPAAVPLTMQDGRVELAAGYAEGLDPEGLVTLLCAVVTRSGFVWQPVFFASQG